MLFFGLLLWLWHRRVLLGGGRSCDKDPLLDHPSLSWLRLFGDDSQLYIIILG